MGPIEIAVIVIVAAFAVAMIVAMIVRKLKGKPSMGSDCCGCPYSGSGCCKCREQAADPPERQADAQD